MKVTSEPVSHPQRAFRFLRFEVDGFQGEPHRHRHLELTWIEAGEGLRFVGDSAEPFRTGDLVLIGSETPHCWVSSSGSAPSIATVLQFTPEFLNQPGLPELAQLVPLAERAALGLAIRGHCHARVTARLDALRSAGAIGQLAALLEILELLLSREIDLAPIAHSPMRAADIGRSTKPASRRIDRVIGWIHREIAQELTVADAANIARITPGGFSRYFRNAVGKTFTQYVNDVRCSEACIRLRQSDRSVALIAAECGFDTMSHFNRQFRSRTGLTPREFRRGRALDAGTVIRRNVGTR
jgi:AraC-like DNA-binding protein